MADARRRLDPSSRLGAPVDAPRARRYRDAQSHPCLHRHHAETMGNLQAQPPPRARPEHRHRRRPERAGRHLPGPSSVADERRNHADPRPPVPHPTALAGVDAGGPGGLDAIPRREGGLSEHGWRGRARRGCCGPGHRRQTRELDPGGALRPALGPVAARGAMDQPPAASARDVALAAGRGHPSPPDGEAHVAVLRGIRRSRRSLPAAGQLPGDPKAGPRAPHVPHQHGSVPPVDGGRPRPRLDRYPGDAGTARGDPRHDGATRALPRAFLQLVRDRYASPAGAALRVNRR